MFGHFFLFGLFEQVVHFGGFGGAVAFAASARDAGGGHVCAAFGRGFAMPALTLPTVAIVPSLWG